MSLGNLSIKVSADVSGLTTSMDIASKSATSSMFASSEAVNEFQKNLLQASENMQKAALSMGSSMEAANDSIMQSAEESEAAITQLTTAANDADFKSMGEKIAEGIGTGVGVGIVAAEHAWNGFVEYSKTKALVIGLAVGAIFTAVGLGAVYAAYKVVSGSMDFIVGLITGDSYKSESIDALIEANKQVKDIQESLHQTELQATATNAAIAAMGVNKSDYVGVFKDAETAVRGNTDELDRLGVKYKDAKGNLLPLNETIKNANDVINSYTQGWDRNQAAQAIGLGSAAAVAAAVSVSSEKIEEARQRLNDYNLGIGAETQEAVKRYEEAMRDFNRESDLTAQGFKRAWADQVMPILTDLAEYFKDGFPVAVNAFRYSMATITSLLYGLKTVAYMVSESVIASLSAVGSIIGGVAVAGVKLMAGDFSGAKDALIAGWDDAKNRIGVAGDNIVAQARHNADAMRMAWGFDGRNEVGIEQAKKGKSWTPAPESKDENTQAVGKDVAKAILEGKLKEQEALISSEKAVLQSREQFLKQYYNSDQLSAEEYYGARNRSIAEAKLAIETAYKAEIAAANEYIDAHKKIEGHKKEVEEGKNKIIEAKKKRAADEMALNNQVMQSYVELENENSMIQRSLLTNAEAEEKLFASRASKIQAFRDAQYYNETAANRMLEAESRRHQEAMINALQNDQKRKQEATALILQNEKTSAAQVTGFWLASNQSILSNQQKTSKMTADAITTATDGVASSISHFILQGKNLGESLRNVAVSIADSFIQGFIKMQIQKFLMDKVAAGAYVATITAQSQAMVAMAALNAFASTAAIPVVGPGLAPAAAAAATAIGEGFAGTATAAAALSVPSARGGFDIPAGVNPLTQLHEEEMVLPKDESNVIRGLAKNSNTSQPSSEAGPIAVHTTINVYPDRPASAQTSTTGGSPTGAATQLADMVNNLVQQGIAQSMRQGGLIWKMKNGQA